MKRTPIIFAVLVITAILFAFGCSHKAESPTSQQSGEPALTEGTVGPIDGPAPGGGTIIDGGGVTPIPQSYSVLKKVTYVVYDVDPLNNKEIIDGEISIAMTDGKLTSATESGKKITKGFAYDESGRVKSRSAAIDGEAIQQLIEYTYEDTKLKQVDGMTLDTSVPSPEPVPESKTEFSYDGNKRSEKAYAYDKTTEKYVENTKRTRVVDMNAEGLPERVKTCSKGIMGTTCTELNKEYDGNAMTYSSYGGGDCSGLCIMPREITLKCETGADCDFDSTGKLLEARYKYEEGGALFATLRVKGTEWDEEGRLLADEVSVLYANKIGWEKELRVRKAKYEYETLNLPAPPTMPPLLTILNELRAMLPGDIDKKFGYLFTSLLYMDRADLLFGKDGLIVN